MTDLFGVFKKISGFVKNIYRGKFFISFLITLVFSILVMVTLYLGSTPSVSRLKEGNISLRTIYAPYDFSYPTIVDEKRTEALRKEFESKVPLLYEVDNSIQEAVSKKIDTFFDVIEEVRNDQSMNLDEKIEIIKSKSQIDLYGRDISTFLTYKNKELDRLRKISKDALENLFITGVIDVKEKTSLINKKIKKISIRNVHFDIERTVTLTDLVDERDAKKVLKATIEGLLPDDRSSRNILYNLLSKLIIVNTRFNEEETVKRKAEARRQAAVIYKRETVKKGELIIEKGKRITKEDIAKLAQIGRVYPVTNKTLYLVGLLVVLLEFVLIAALYLISSEKKILVKPKNIVFITLNILIGIIVSLLIIQYRQTPYLIPLAGIGMLLSLILNANISFIIVLMLSTYIGILANGRIDLAVVLFTGGAVGGFVVSGARRRSQIFLSGFIVALVNFVSVSGIGFLNNIGKEAIFKEGFYGIAGGIISSFVVIGLLPVYEFLFNYITDITLLELSDFSNPLLKELTIKAPGTYQHSILVGNLAEEACNAIGANALLARVGAYYHDIGKIEKAEYFAENQMGRPSKHERLSPPMSALIITNHVKDGIELAKKYKLNKALVNFIAQHHGSSLIYYFYQKAIEQSKTTEAPEEGEYRYPGPKPQSKEVAIVLLADAVEASSRILSEPTPARIRNLVQKIINNKFIDGQLDECELTLRDLHKISEAFVRVLTAVFHTRVEYPEFKPQKSRKNAP